MIKMRDYAALIQNILARANDPRLDNEAERAHLFATAERLQRKFRIEVEEAIATDATSAVPIRHDITLRVGDAYSDMSHWYTSVFASIARHTEIRYITRYVRDDEGRYNMVATVVGYEGDIRYAEFLWTAASLMFSTRIDPVWDASLPEAENIWRLRNAGIERRKIADRAWGNGTEASARSRVQRVYLRECERRGEPARASGLSHQTDVYREAYAREFRNTLARRLADARDAVDAVDGALVLHGRKQRVDEAFYDQFPMYRPTDGPTPAPTPEPCAACKRAKSGHCRQHPAARWTADDERRWQRFNTSDSAIAGGANGKHAAEGVVITRGHDRAQRLDPSGRAIES